MAILSKLPEYLGLSDTDYLSARLLIMSGVPLQGLGKACEAFEKQFKLFFALNERIINKREITQKELRKYGHDVVKLLESYNDTVPQERRLESDWKDLMAMLKAAYNLRYPEHWKQIYLNIDLTLDRIRLTTINQIISVQFGKGLMNVRQEAYKSFPNEAI